MVFTRVATATLPTALAVVVSGGPMTGVVGCGGASAIDVSADGDFPTADAGSEGPAASSDAGAVADSASEDGRPASLRVCACEPDKYSIVIQPSSLMPMIFAASARAPAVALGDQPDGSQCWMTAPQVNVFLGEGGGLASWTAFGCAETSDPTSSCIEVGTSGGHLVDSTGADWMLDSLTFTGMTATALLAPDHGTFTATAHRGGSPDQAVQGFVIACVGSVTQGI